MNNRPFNYVCMRCWQKAIETQDSYRGVVNLNVLPISPTVWDLEHTCFTCGSHWFDRLDVMKTEYNKPDSKKDFHDKMRKRTIKKAD